MDEQNKKETRPTKPPEGEEGGAGKYALAKKGKKLKEDGRAAKAIVRAWYDVMAMLGNKKTRDEAITKMAAAAGASTEQFTKMLGGTDLFTDAERAREFLTGDKIKETEKSVKTFLLKHDQLQDDSVKLKYDAQFLPGEK